MIDFYAGPGIAHFLKSGGTGLQFKDRPTPSGGCIVPP
jgi:hypothetical protein